MKKGGERHEKKLKEVIQEFKRKGYKVVDLEGKSPDAIAVKDNVVCAVEVLGRVHRKNRGWKKDFTIIQKKSLYSMFDKVFIRTFRRGERQQ